MKTVKFKTEKEVKKFLTTNRLGINRFNIAINNMVCITGFEVSNKHISGYSARYQGIKLINQNKDGYFVITKAKFPLYENHIVI